MLDGSVWLCQIAQSGDVSSVSVVMHTRLVLLPDMAVTLAFR